MYKTILGASCLVLAVGCSKPSQELDTPHAANLTNAVDKSICDATTQITNTVYRPLRSGTLRTGWQKDSSPVINQKYLEVSGKSEARVLDVEYKVLEQCTFKGASYIKIIEPDYIHESGWIDESVLKSKDANNPYDGKIASSVYEPWSAGYYEGSKSKFSGMKDELKKLEIKAAEKIIDQGKCDVVEMVSTDGKSTIENPVFEVNCLHGQTFIISKQELSSDSIIKSNHEKAISKTDAFNKCKSMVLVSPGYQQATAFGTSNDANYHLVKENGNVALTLAFKNNDIEQKVRCIFEPTGHQEIAFQPHSNFSPH